MATPPKYGSIEENDYRSPLSKAYRKTSQADLEPMHKFSSRTTFAINISLAMNIILAIAKLYATIASGSLAVLSTLVDSILDLTSQGLFWYTDKYMHTPSVQYPAGRRRLEPIAVIVSATLMGMAALEVIQSSVEALFRGFNGAEYSISMTESTIVILGCAIVIKMALWYYCSTIGQASPSANALAQDHRNDVLSNAVAVGTSVLAHYHGNYWYVDPIGGIVISVYITLSWFATGKEQVEQLVGIQADSSFIEYINNLADNHHPLMKSDIVRAYHFGNNFLVELEVILPETMCVAEAHDISLALQMKVEDLDVVERAFVHVDYRARGYDEHKDPTMRRLSSQLSTEFQ